MVCISVSLASNVAAAASNDVSDAVVSQMAFNNVRPSRRPACDAPGSTVKRAITPKPIKQLRRAAHPIDNAVYSLERSLNTKRRGRAAVDRHGNCPVKHRSRAAMINCRNQ